MSDTRKLPVFDSMGEVLSGVTRHYVQLLTAAWPAVALIFVMVLVQGWQYYNAGVFAAYVGNNGSPDMEAILAAQQELSGFGAQLVSWTTQLLLLFASAVAAVRWHRFVLLGEGANGLGDVQPLRKEDGTYVWATLKIFGVVIVAILAVVLVTSLLGVLKPSKEMRLILSIPVLVFVVWLYLGFLRIMLALPDAALGQGGRVFDMYKASRGNGWRLFGLAFLIGIVIVVAMVAIGFVVVAVSGAVGISFASSPTILAAAALLYLGIYLYFLMAQITMLSVAYREIIGLPTVPSASAAAPDAPRIEPV